MSRLPIPVTTHPPDVEHSLPASPRGVAIAVASACIVIGSVGCGNGNGSPTSPGPSSATATIDEVVVSRRGVEIGAQPVVFDPQEIAEIMVRLTMNVPAGQALTLYFCVLQTPASIGIGTCNALIAPAEQIGPLFQAGIRPSITDGRARTTDYVYVALIEGTLPWRSAFTGQGSPPGDGDRFGTDRVLDTMLIPRTLTFQ
jgi:hypothetical protein